MVRRAPAAEMSASSYFSVGKCRLESRVLLAPGASLREILHEYQSPPDGADETRAQ